MTPFMPFFVRRARAYFHNIRQCEMSVKGGGRHGFASYSITCTEHIEHDHRTLKEMKLEQFERGGVG